MSDEEILQDYEEKLCRTCGGPPWKVYCSSQSDVWVRLDLRARGLGQWARAIHRVDVG